MAATIRRTSGRTASKVGKATSHERPQAPSQRLAKAGPTPTARPVEMAETTEVMRMESTSGMTMAP